MQTVRRRCAQTAHISLLSHQCQRAIVRQKRSDPPVSQRIHACLVFGSSGRFRPVPQRLRFGEGLSRGLRRGPQEEKVTDMQKFAGRSKISGKMA